MNAREPKKDIFIPVMGATGAGKSFFINTLLGQNRMTIGRDLGSCTSELGFGYLENVEGYPDYRIVLVDTPGFDDTIKTDFQILETIATWLKESYKKGSKLGGIIYLHDISSPRFLGTARRNLQMFQSMCGEKALAHVVLGTTKWALNLPDFEKRHNQLEGGDYWGPLIRKGAKVGRFDNTYDSAWNFINAIISDARHQTVLSIQEELVSKEMILSKTQAAQDLFTPNEVLAIQKKLQSLDTDGSDDLQAQREARVKVEPLKTQLKDSNNPLRVSMGPRESKKDIVILVMGATGVGKSFFINTLLRENKMAVGKDLKSCTSELGFGYLENVEGYPNYRVVLVDTPGFDDTVESAFKILETIATWVKESCKKGSKLGAIYLHDIGEPRVTGPERKNLRMFRSLCGEKAIDHVFLGTTKWVLNVPDSERRYDQLQGDDYWGPLIDKGAKVGRFDNTYDSAWKFINAIISDARHQTVLSIQEELVSKDMLLSETQAAQDMRLILNEVLAIEKKLQSLDTVGSDELEVLLKEVEVKVQLLETQLKNLKIPLSQRLRKLLSFFSPINAIQFT